MNEPFWQRSLDSLTYDAIAAFVENGIAENDHLEYKMPSLNQEGKFEFRDEFLETIVAFANSDGGLILVGVAEDGHKHPTTIEGMRVTNPRKPSTPPRDPEQVLRSVCAARIEPTASLEIRTVALPADHPTAGNKLLLVRVRRGLLSPYNLRDQGIYIRNDDADRRASVREIEDLLNRRITAADQFQTPWSRTLRNTFTRSQLIWEAPPILMIGLTPAFSIDPITIDHHSDRLFTDLCLTLFGGQEYPVTEPDGIAYNPYLHEHVEGKDEHPPFACGYADGSIGIRDIIDFLSTWPEGRPRPLPLDLSHVWRKTRQFLITAQRWPRDVCHYGGPLVCRIALTNLVDTIAVVPDTG